ncbi:MAG: hypothetical protein WC564_02880 [Patescibacteria group bacterium]
MKVQISDIQLLLAAIESKGMLISEVIDLINGGVKQQKRNKLSLPINKIKLIVDYSKTIDQAIDDGSYADIHFDITAENFPILNDVDGLPVAICGKLFHFNRDDISSEDAIKRMGRAGYRPAKIRELLALGAAHPELQMKFLIVALGSVFSPPKQSPSVDLRVVPALEVVSGRRKIGLLNFVGGWNIKVLFFGILK